MVDINFGNKTLAFGVAIALILSYGMVNFDSSPKTPQVFSVAAAPTQDVVADQKVAALAKTDGQVGRNRRKLMD